VGNKGTSDLASYDWKIIVFMSPQYQKRLEPIASALNLFEVDVEIVGSKKPFSFLLPPVF
jgi:hypothetical protein